MTREYNELNLKSNKLKDRISKLVKNHNILKWDIGASLSLDSSVQVDKGIAKQLKSAQRNSLTLRIWNKKGLVGITSTSDLTEKGLDNAISAAYEASNFGNPNEIPQFSSLAKAELPLIKRPMIDPLGIKHLFKLLCDAEKQLINSHKSIKSVPYNGLSESIYERIYFNSDGAKREIKRTQSSIYLYARSLENGKKPRSSGSLRIANGVNELDIKGCIDEASMKTISHLDYAPIETGKYLVCFKPDSFLDLIGSFSNIFNARSILDGISLSTRNSIGEEISVPEFNLIDDGLNSNYIGAVPFDGEGTPTQKITLIENGLIKNFIHSEATARAFNVKPTGHAGLGSKVSVTPDWFVVNRKVSSNKTQKLNHQSTKDTFVLIESLSALHAGVKATQGSFSLPFDGWLVKNGNPISIEAATVAGDIKSLLKNIIEIENKQLITHNGISPHIWVSELSITGEK